MCWQTKNVITKGFKHSLRSTEDIEVYKIGYIVNDIFYSYYSECGYKINMPNEVINLHLFSYFLTYVRIEQGYHSYSEECYVRECITDNIDIYSPVSEKINNFDNYDEIYEQFAIGKFIIPKGSEYYENEYGEIVSSQIIWTGERYSINGYKYTTKVKFKENRLCVGK